MCSALYCSALALLLLQLCCCCVALSCHLSLKKCLPPCYYCSLSNFFYYPPLPILFPISVSCFSEYSSFELPRRRCCLLLLTVRLGRRDKISLVALWRGLEELKNKGDVSFFTVGQSNLENIFLRFAALTEESVGGSIARASLGHAHLLRGNGSVNSESEGESKEQKKEEDDGTWGPNWWDSSATRYVVRGDAKVTGATCLFGRYGGFSSQTPVREKWATEVPVRLSSRGVTEEEWERFIEGLEAAQRKTTSCNICRCIHCCMISLSILTFSWGWLCMCCGWSKCDPYQVAMKNLMTMLNEEILKSKGMYAKIPTFGGLDDSGETPLKGRDSNALPVLVFALTSKEKRRLEAESVLHKPESEKDTNWQCWDCPAHAGRVL